MTVATDREHRISRSRRRVALAGLVLAAALVWWAWPSLTGRDDRLGVLVIADPFLEPARRSIELRARETGRSVEWQRLPDEWCHDPDAVTRFVAERDPAHVVVAAGIVDRCPPAVSELIGESRAVVVVEPGTGADAAALAVVEHVVDPERLVGRPGDDPRRTCEWWETCEGDGRIDVRDATGALTVAGGERVARMIVAAL